MKRVFGVDVEVCPACEGAMRIIACIEDSDVIKKILSHLDEKGPEVVRARLLPCGSHRVREQTVI